MPRGRASGQSSARATPAIGGERAEAIARAARDFDAGHRDLFERFVPLLLTRLERSEASGLPAEVLASIVKIAFEHFAGRRPGQRVIAVERVPFRAGDRAEHAGGRETGVTVVVAGNDDKPFLVSSVLGELQARTVRPQLVLHPLLRVRRDAHGSLTDLQGATDGADDGRETGAARSDPWRDESLILVVAAPLDEASADTLAGAIGSVLDEVDAAVTDWSGMMARLDAAIAALEARNVATADPLVAETLAFCRWMRAGNFVFLGMREYRIDGAPETGGLQVVAGSGLGILADPEVHVLRRGRELVALTDEVRRFYLKPWPIIITKSNVVSRVHRRVHMDYVGLKTFGADGRLTGELRMVGLFTATAYTAPPAEIPFLRLKAERVFAESGVKRASHEGRMLQNILDTFPRDELFQIGVRQLASWVPALLQLEFDPRVRVLVRRDRFDRFVSVLVFVPRDRFSTAVRERIGALLADAFKGRMVTFQPYFTQGPLVRVHYIIGRYEGRTPEIEESSLEEAVEDIAATWNDRLAAELSESPERLARYATAFSSAYAETFGPARALDDIDRIERLSDEAPAAIDFYGGGAGSSQSSVRVAIYRFDHAIPLSERVPLLENMGFTVIDERTYTVKPVLGDRPREVFIHDMTLVTFDRRAIDLVRVDAALEDAFLAVFSGRAENDAFNRLVLAAECDWREAAMLRAYAGYMRQIGLPHGPRYIAETLVKHADRARDLVRLFKVRLDPGSPLDDAGRTRREVDWRTAFEGALASVESLNEDRILRSLASLVAATVRTNYFMCDEHGSVPQTIAFKLATRDVADAPAPRPFREIWVSSPEVDGVHLRFAPIARGGLRWSDRPQDFRTEVLGLAKAQQVKNTVIVPQGAKGGFVPKRIVPGAARDEVMRVGIAAYRTFVSTLLDITDNLAGHEIVHPAGVTRRDGDDPYLVVAADKGTATFSDFANALSADHHFWLDDAFASGGSAGYDHKKMGITARGAWECVKRHFREMDHDIQSEPVRVIGVGDMSGDVFGNGMLLSRKIRLVAAFDHRDIFIDPEPDAEASFVERQRIFALPRSSWQDYDRSLISKGGGVFSRSAKSVAVTAQMRVLLGIDAASVTPAELMRAVLMGEADLLWLGGIGTYVRGDGESDAEVGDRANDAIRIPASGLRVKAIGEGANLGLTQRGRIDAAVHGVRLNTDFIDNSAGVNSSDQEVNIKIALSPVLADGRLDRAARNSLLVTMTDDVARACLANNYEQSLALSLAERRGAEAMGDWQHLMRSLEARGILDRKLEGLPGDGALGERRKAGRGLTRPELAVLLAHAKIALSYDLIASKVPDGATMRPLLASYFPPALQHAYASDIAAHPLAREIVTTELTNRIVNMCGPDLPSRLADDWGLDVEASTQAMLGALDMLDAEGLFAAIGGLDTRIGGSNQLSLYAEAQRLVRRQAATLASLGRRLAALDHAMPAVADVFRRLVSQSEGVLTAPRIAERDARMAEWNRRGAPIGVAAALAEADVLSEAADIALVAREAHVGDERLAEAARVHFAIGDALRLSELRRKGQEIPSADRYDRLAINSALAGLAASHRAMTVEALALGGKGSSAAEPGRTVEAWRAAHASSLARVEAGLAEAIEGAPLSVARLTVAAALARDIAGV